MSSAVLARNTNVFVFAAADMRFGCELEAIERVLPALSMIDTPSNRSDVAGVINFAGMAIPVLSMRQVLRRESKPLALSDFFVIIHDSGAKLALWVDGIEGVVELSNFDTPQGADAESGVRGICVDAEGPLFLIDLRKVLDRSEREKLVIGLENARANA